MSTKTLLAMGLCAAIGFTRHDALAAKPARGSSGEEHAASTPSTLEGIRAKIFEQHRALHDAVTSNQVSEAHTHLSIPRSLSEASLGKIVAADRPYVYSTVTNIAAVTDELEKATASANPAAIQTAHGKLDGALKTLENELVRARPVAKQSQYKAPNKNRGKRYAAPRRNYTQPRIVRPRNTRPPAIHPSPQPPRPPAVQPSPQKPPPHATPPPQPDAKPKHKPN